MVSAAGWLILLLCYQNLFPAVQSQQSRSAPCFASLLSTWNRGNQLTFQTVGAEREGSQPGSESAPSSHEEGKKAEQGHYSLHLAFRTGPGCSDWHHCSHFGIMKGKPRQPVSPPYSVVKHTSGRLRVSEPMKNLNKTPRSFSNHLSVWI